MFKALATLIPRHRVPVFYAVTEITQASGSTTISQARATTDVTAGYAETVVKGES